MSDEGSMKFGLERQVFLRPAPFGTDSLEVSRQNLPGANSGWGSGHGDRMVSSCRFCVSRVYVTMTDIFGGCSFLKNRRVSCGNSNPPRFYLFIAR